MTYNIAIYYNESKIGGPLLAALEKKCQRQVTPDQKKTDQIFKTNITREGQVQKDTVYEQGCSIQITAKKGIPAVNPQEPLPNLIFLVSRCTSMNPGYQAGDIVLFHDRNDPDLQNNVEKLNQSISGSDKSRILEILFCLHKGPADFNEIHQHLGITNQNDSDEVKKNCLLPYSGFLWTFTNGRFFISKEGKDALKEYKAQPSQIRLRQIAGGLNLGADQQASDLIENKEMPISSGPEVKTFKASLVHKNINQRIKSECNLAGKQIVELLFRILSLQYNEIEFVHNLERQYQRNRLRELAGPAHNISGLEAQLFRSARGIVDMIPVQNIGNLSSVMPFKSLKCERSADEVVALKTPALLSMHEFPTPSYVLLKGTKRELVFKTMRDNSVQGGSIQLSSIVRDQLGVDPGRTVEVQLAQNIAHLDGVKVKIKLFNQNAAYGELNPIDLQNECKKVLQNADVINVGQRICFRWLDRLFEAEIEDCTNNNTRAPYGIIGTSAIQYNLSAIPAAYLKNVAPVSSSSRSNMVIDAYAVSSNASDDLVNKFTGRYISQVLVPYMVQKAVIANQGRHGSNQALYGQACRNAIALNYNSDNYQMLLARLDEVIRNTQGIDIDKLKQDPLLEQAKAKFCAELLDSRNQKIYVGN